MKRILTSLAIGLIIGAITSAVVTKLVWPTIETIDLTTEPTTKLITITGDGSQAEYDLLMNCFNRALTIKATLDNDHIKGLCSDGCKQAEFDIKIKIKNVKKHILQAGVGLGFYPHKGYYTSIGYLRKFTLLNIGANVKFSTNGIGSVELVIQKEF
jgi:hypothetical protein